MVKLNFIDAIRESEYFGKYGKHFVQHDEAEDYVEQLRSLGWKNARVKHEFVGPGGLWTVRYGRFYDPVLERLESCRPDVRVHSHRRRRA